MLLFHGDKDERARMIEENLVPGGFDVVVTSYEMVVREAGAFRKFSWRYLIVDEAHRMKNEDSKLSQILRTYSTHSRLLITGTPLQNNLHELWALLHFLHPELFADSAVFDAAFDLGRGQIDEGVIAKCGQLLSAFMVRRLKRDVLATLPKKTEATVYVPMSMTQVELSRQLLLSGAQVLARMQAQTDEAQVETDEVRAQADEALSPPRP